MKNQLPDRVILPIVSGTHAEGVFAAAFSIRLENSPIEIAATLLQEGWQGNQAVRLTIN
jgi:hypothetical protein